MPATSILPAVVTIQDLPTGTTLTGGELLEAVQTVAGVAQSVQITVNQIATTAFGTLPSGGGTGQLLQSLGTSFAATWVNVATSVVIAGTGLAQAGSTAVTLSLASTAPLSVLGVAGNATAVPAAMTGTADQVLVVNHAGNAVGFGAVNLATSAAVTGFLPGTSIATATITGAQIVTATIGTTQLLAAAGLSVLAVASSGTTAFSVVTGAANQVLVVNSGGTSVVWGALNLAAAAAVTGTLSTANVPAISVATTGNGGITGQPFFLPTTALPANGASTMGIKISSAAGPLGFFVGNGTPTFAAGTGSLYVNNAAATTGTRLYINTSGATTWANFTASA